MMTPFKIQKNLRAALEHFIVQNQDARSVVRAHALLWRDEGIPVGEIAQRLKTSRQSIYNWSQRFQQRQGFTLERRLADAARSGRPATAKGIIDPLIDEVIDQDPRQWGYRATVWTAALLAIYLGQEHGIHVSSDSVSLALARLRIRWKRPRHTLGLRKRTWRQAKGGLKRG
jgi:transposase